MFYSTAQQMEHLDSLAVENGLEIRQMMELAGWHMVGFFNQIGIAIDQKIIVVVGKGNKGGDGLSAARHLVNYGYSVHVLLLSRDISMDSMHHLNLLERMDVPILDYTMDVLYQELSESDCVIDALIGYHLHGDPRNEFKDAIEAMNMSGKKIIAYDIPSGLDAQLLKPSQPTIQAHATLTLALAKTVLTLPEYSHLVGLLAVADIGIPEFLYNMIHPSSRPDFDVRGLHVIHD